MNEQVPSIEVDKFKRDTSEKKAHGIMIAQSTGIATKIDQQIEINNGCILVYLCNNKLNASSIKTAVEVIRCLSGHIRLSEPLLAADDECDHKIVSNENVARIIEELNNITNVNTRIKDNLKATINIINFQHVKNIQRLLTGEYVEPVIQPKTQVKSKAASLSHKQVNKKLKS